MKGEEEQTFWINEAWEGTKIGADIYVNMRPRPVQYNRLSNPSRCHFGIIGQIYSNNGDQSFSLVDIMKPYAYLYDVIHDRLNKTLARNHGKVIKLDFAKTPKGWDAPMWLHYIFTGQNCLQRELAFACITELLLRLHCLVFGLFWACYF